MRYRITAAALKSALTGYRKRLMIEKNIVGIRYWEEIRNIYSKGWFVQLFNPRLVQFFKNNKVPTPEAVAYVKEFLLPEHSFKLDYGLSHLDGQLAVVDAYLNQCEGCMTPEKDRVIVEEEVLQSWGMFFDQKTDILGITTITTGGGGGGGTTTTLREIGATTIYPLIGMTR